MFSVTDFICVDRIINTIVSMIWNFNELLKLGNFTFFVPESVTGMMFLTVLYFTGSCIISSGNQDQNT
jgi:hypothetical protein